MAIRTELLSRSQFRPANNRLSGKIIEELTFSIILQTWNYQTSAFSYRGDFKIYVYYCPLVHHGYVSLPEHLILLIYDEICKNAAVIL